MVASAACIAVAIIKAEVAQARSERAKPSIGAGTAASRSCIPGYFVKSPYADWKLIIFAGSRQACGEPLAKPVLLTFFLRFAVRLRPAQHVCVPLHGRREGKVRLTTLVTPDGQWVFAGSSEFLAALGDPDPDYDAETFAVKNLGFVKMSMIDKSIIEIELHPRNVSLPAVLAVQQQVQSAGVKLFRIRHFDTVWHSEITSSAEQAMVRLSQLTAPTFVAPFQHRFVVEPKEYSQLLDDDDNELRFMAQKWRAAFGRFDSTVISFAINHQLLPRMAIIGVKPRPAEPVFRFLGEAHSNWLDRKHHSLIGESLQNLPDKDYGNWASEFYKDVASTGQPRFDCVTAMIHRQSGPYQTRYERLVLPWTTPSDEILVTVCNRRLSEEGMLSPLGPSDSSLARNSLKSA
jgi:hypothetical protein